MLGQPNLISIGRITTTQGIHGEVRVFPLTDFLERFKQLEKIYLNLNGELSCLTVESTRPHKQFILVKFMGIDTLEEGQGLKNALIQIPKEELISLPEGHYYIFEIIGLSVCTVDGKYLGRVKDVFRTGSNDVYQVVNEDSKEVLVPALRDIVEEIDLEKQRIMIRPLPGMLEI